MFLLVVALRLAHLATMAAVLRTLQPDQMISERLVFEEEAQNSEESQF